MSRRLTKVAAALAALMLCGTASAETLALVGGTVHTVSGPTLENGTVVIENGRIVAVGAGLAPPAGARVIQVSGKHVYPGLIASNSVLGLTEIESVRGTNDYEETGDINPNIRSEVQINPDSDLLPVARVNGVTSALIVPQGGALAGTSALIHLDGWTAEDMTIRAPIALHINFRFLELNQPKWVAPIRAHDRERGGRVKAAQRRAVRGKS